MFGLCLLLLYFFFSSIRRHTSCALVTGVRRVLFRSNRLLLLVLLVIVFAELLHHRIDLDVHFGLVVGGAGNDQRRARLVDQDRIDLVDDREVERPLHHRAAFVLHVVAQIIEAEFVVGAVGDIGGIRIAPLLVGPIGGYRSDERRVGEEWGS